MYYCAHIGEKKKEEWERLVAGNRRSGFHQSFGWAKFKQLDGWDTYKIGLFAAADDRLVGGAVIYEFGFSDGTSFLYLPEGPVLDYDDEEKLFWQWRALETALHSIVKLKAEETTTHIRIEPRSETLPEWFRSGWHKAPLNLQPRHTQVVSLVPGESAIAAAMKPKGRYNIRIAQKRGVTVATAPVAEVGDFFRLYRKTCVRDKFEGKDKEMFLRLFEGMGRQAELFFAEAAGRRLATAIVMYYGGRATYLYGASDDEQRNYMAPYLLHWEIMMEAKRRGYREYDFWGVAPSLDKPHEWAGLTVFKKKFGGEQLDLVGAWDYVLQQDKYDAFVRKHEA